MQYCKRCKETSTVRVKMNEAYYGQQVSPLDILINHKVKNAGADKLIMDVSEAANAKK
jgi:hypothetical protein